MESGERIWLEKDLLGKLFQEVQKSSKFTSWIATCRNIGISYYTLAGNRSGKYSMGAPLFNELLNYLTKEQKNYFVSNSDYSIKPSKKYRNEIISLIKANVSLNKISKKFGISKSTIYYHYRKIKPKRYPQPNFTPSFSEKEGEIVGIFSGDGSQHFEKDRHHYITNVHFGNNNYAQYVKSLFESFFDKRFRLRSESLGRSRITTESKKIFKYFETYLDYAPQTKHCTVKLKTLDLPTQFKVGFLRGLLDTDGTISFKKNDRTPRIIYYTTSPQLAKQTKSLLVTLGIASNTYKDTRTNKKAKDCYHVYLLAKDKKKFVNLIKPFKAKKWAGRLAW